MSKDQTLPPFRGILPKNFTSRHRSGLGLKTAAGLTLRKRFTSSILQKSRLLRNTARTSRPGLQLAYSSLRSRYIDTPQKQILRTASVKKTSESVWNALDLVLPVAGNSSAAPAAPQSVTMPDNIFAPPPSLSAGQIISRKEDDPLYLEGQRRKALREAQPKKPTLTPSHRLYRHVEEVLPGGSGKKPSGSHSETSQSAPVHSTPSTPPEKVMPASPAEKAPEPPLPPLPATNDIPHTETPPPPAPPVESHTTTSARRPAPLRVLPARHPSAPAQQTAFPPKQPVRRMPAQAVAPAAVRQSPAETQPLDTQAASTETAPLTQFQPTTREQKPLAQPQSSRAARLAPAAPISQSTPPQRQPTRLSASRLPVRMVKRATPVTQPKVQRQMASAPSAPSAPAPAAPVQPATVSNPLGAPQPLTAKPNAAPDASQPAQPVPDRPTAPPSLTHPTQPARLQSKRISFRPATRNRLPVRQTDALSNPKTIPAHRIESSQHRPDAPIPQHTPGKTPQAEIRRLAARPVQQPDQRNSQEPVDAPATVPIEPEPSHTQPPTQRLPSLPRPAINPLPNAPTRPSELPQKQPVVVPLQPQSAPTLHPTPRPSRPILRMPARPVPAAYTPRKSPSQPKSEPISEAIAAQDTAIPPAEPQIFSPQPTAPTTQLPIAALRLPNEIPVQPQPTPKVLRRLRAMPRKSAAALPQPVKALPQTPHSNEQPSAPPIDAVPPVAPTAPNPRSTAQTTPQPSFPTLRAARRMAARSAPALRKPNITRHNAPLTAQAPMLVRRAQHTNPPQTPNQPLPLAALPQSDQPTPESKPALRPVHPVENPMRPVSRPAARSTSVAMPILPVQRAAQPVAVVQRMVQGSDAALASAPASFPDSPAAEPAQAAPAQLDLAQVAAQVYPLVLRKLAIEKERLMGRLR